ncbi:MAG: hypothetical protein Q9202_002337 [Teloschistes flavicans]
MKRAEKVRDETFWANINLILLTFKLSCFFFINLRIVLLLPNLKAAMDVDIKVTFFMVFVFNTFFIGMYAAHIYYPLSDVISFQKELLKLLAYTSGRSNRDLKGKHCLTCLYDGKGALCKDCPFPAAWEWVVQTIFSAAAKAGNLSAKKALSDMLLYGQKRLDKFAPVSDDVGSSRDGNDELDDLEADLGIPTLEQYQEIIDRHGSLSDSRSTLPLYHHFVAVPGKNPSTSTAKAARPAATAHNKVNGSTRDRSRGCLSPPKNNATPSKAHKARVERMLANAVEDIERRKVRDGKGQMAAAKQRLQALKKAFDVGDVEKGKMI